MRITLSEQIRQSLNNKQYYSNSIVIRTVNMDPYAESPYNRKGTFTGSNAPFTPSYVVSRLSLSSDPTAKYASRVWGRQMLLDKPACENRTKKEMNEKRLRRKKQKESESLELLGRGKLRRRGCGNLTSVRRDTFF